MAASSPAIRRGFVDVPFGQVHIRTAGEGRPLLMIHASPGSSRQLVPMIESLARHRRVLAPDTPGFGDSSPHPLANPAIRDYADALRGTLDALGIERTDVYGSHTGACIAAELAIAAPECVNRLILDGVGLFEGSFQQRLLAHYAPTFTPDPDGAYLIRAFHFCRDQTLFWPWFDRTREARRQGGVLPPDQLHAWVIEVLKAAETYPLGYRAAFSWPVRERLPLITPPTLMIAASDDPLAQDTEALAPLVPHGRFMPLPHSAAPTFIEARIAGILDHFA